MDKKIISQIIKDIEENDTIIIHRHVRPDGDCVGSQNGLKLTIKKNFPNKNVYAVGDNVENLQYLGAMDDISADLYVNALVIVVDTANEARIEDTRYKLANKIIKIDHHPGNDNYGTINWVDPKFGATAEMIAELIKVANWTMTDEAVKLIFTGIVTDTGRFMYRSVTKDTFMRVSFLMSNNNLDLVKSYEDIYIRPLNVVRFEAFIATNFITSARGTAYINIPASTLSEYNITAKEASNCVNVMANILGVHIWCLFYEDEKTGSVRGSLRSRSVKINDVATKYNGGGHANACGISLKSFSDVDDVVKDLDSIILK